MNIICSWSQGDQRRDKSVVQSGMGVCVCVEREGGGENAVLFLHTYQVLDDVLPRVLLNVR